MNVLRQSSINCFVAFGVLVVIASGNMDLSIGTNLALCSCVIGCMVKYFGVTSVPVLLICGIACGVFVGALNGIIFTKLHIPSAFIVTLAMQMVWPVSYTHLNDEQPIRNYSQRTVCSFCSNCATR